MNENKNNQNEPFLPVEALNKYVVDYALGIKTLKENMDDDVEYNDLSNTIVFIAEHDRIMIPAEMKAVEGKFQITLSLTFGQYLWSIGLFLITYFDNCVQIPMMNAAGTNIHEYKANMSAVKFANDTFARARTLINLISATL